MDDENSFITQRVELKAWPCWNCEVSVTLRDNTLLTTASATKNTMTPAVSILRSMTTLELFLRECDVGAICIWRRRKEEKAERASVSTEQREWSKKKSTKKTRASRQQRVAQRPNTSACTTIDRCVDNNHALDGRTHNNDARARAVRQPPESQHEKQRLALSSGRSRQRRRFGSDAHERHDADDMIADGRTSN